jgi:hypothetical protein
VAILFPFQSTGKWESVQIGRRQYTSPIYCRPYAAV